MTDGREKRIYLVTILGSIGNLLLLLFKFFAGIFGHSAAMVADAVHSSSDFLTDILVLVFVKISAKPRDKDHDYGHGKYETLASTIIGIILFVVGIGILYGGIKAIWGFFHGEELIQPSLIALIAAIVSIVIKEGLYQYTIRVGRAVGSPVVEANAWHHRTDALSSIGTMIGIGGAIFLGEKWVILDPIAAIIVSIFILKAAYSITLRSVNELMEQSLPDSMEQEILQLLLSYSEVKDPHNLRTRRIGNDVAIEVHIRMNGALTVSASHTVTQQLETRLKELFGDNTFISIHVEPIK